jgi:hypothetical protein
MAQEATSERVLSAGAEDRTALLARELDRTTRWGLWALPVWTVLLFLGTLTHQPDTRTDFAGFARYVTTTEFLLSHLVASIIGAAIGVLGLLALFTFLALRVRSPLAAAGLMLAVVGDVLITAVFGMAAFGQPAVGRLYLAGQTADAVATYNDMYRVPLTATAAAGVLLLVIGVIALGIAIARSRVLPSWAGIGMAVGIVVFSVIGVLLADVVQSIGAVLLVASTLWLADSARRAPDLQLGAAPRATRAPRPPTVRPGPPT